MLHERKQKQSQALSLRGEYSDAASLRHAQRLQQTTPKSVTVTAKLVRRIAHPNALRRTH